MLKCIYRLFAIAVIIFINPLLTLAQQDDSLYYKPNKLYFMAGGTVGATTSGVLGALNGTIIINRLVFSGKVSNTDYNFLTYLKDRNHDIEYALMAGKRLPSKRFANLNVTAGLSLIRSFKRDELTETFNSDTKEDRYDLVRSSTIGIPIEIKYWDNYISRFIDSNISLVANVNTKKPYLGIVIGFQLGNTRERRNKNSKN